MIEPLYSWIFMIKIGFLPVRIWDLLDILIVGYLLYRVYRLLKGNIAFNILIGVVVLFLIWQLVLQLDMVVLKTAIQRFTREGLILTAIVFQQEIRRFLINLGNTTLKQRAQILGRFLDRNLKSVTGNEENINALHDAIMRMSKKKTGALIVFTNDLALDAIKDSGVRIDALITQNLIESIFSKLSPLHDGAVLINKERIIAASCILPISEKTDLPKSAGLRHRAAVGVTERFKVSSFVVSEETGRISYAYGGKLQSRIGGETLKAKLRQTLA